jgi:hypothetical protein
MHITNTLFVDADASLLALKCVEFWLRHQWRENKKYFVYLYSILYSVLAKFS